MGYRDRAKGIGAEEDGKNEKKELGKGVEKEIKDKIIGERVKVKEKKRYGEREKGGS